MSRLCCILVAAGVAAFASAPAPAAQIQIIQGASVEDAMQIRSGMAQGRAKTGTARISGRVIAAETGTPLRRAQVRLSGPEVGMRAALTDGDGRFDFRDLPAGRVKLQATKPGYMSIEYGQRRPFESGRSIELADKQALENVDVAMPRGSVIAGRILDEFGEPVPDVMVNVLRQTWSNGRRRLQPVGARVSATNDLGQYRIYGLPPGEYFVSATLLRGPDVMALDMLAGSPVPRPATPSSGYAPTYFPGTPNAADAQRIAVGLGQEANADFGLLPVRLSRISGIVLGSDGKPLESAMVMLAPADGVMMPLGASTRTGAGGAFALNDVAPGQYVLQVRSIQVITTSDGGGRAMVFTARVGDGGSDGQTETGSMPLSVGGEDLENVVVVTSRGGRAAGRVVFEDGAKPASASIRVSAMPTEQDLPFMGGVSSAGAGSNGAFELKGLTGPRLFRVMNPPPGWKLKAVRLNGTDITDTGVDLKSDETVTGVEIVLTTRTSTLAGAVSGADGTPVSDYTVVVFAEDPELWRLPQTRWVAAARPDQDGRFRLQDLPAGSYYAVALDYLPDGEWHDPELLERLRVSARRVVLEDNVQTLDLKLVESY
jgi:hypothetical protein